MLAHNGVDLGGRVVVQPRVALQRGLLRATISSSAVRERSLEGVQVALEADFLTSFVRLGNFRHHP